MTTSSRWIAVVIVTIFAAAGSRAALAQPGCGELSGPKVTICLVPKSGLGPSDPGVLLHEDVDCYWPTDKPGTGGSVQVRSRADGSSRKFEFEVKNRCKAPNDNEELEIDVVLTLAKGTIQFEDECGSGDVPMTIALGPIRQNKVENISCKTRKYKFDAAGGSLMTSFGLQATRLRTFDKSTKEGRLDEPLVNKKWDPEIVLEKAGRIIQYSGFWFFE